MQGSIVESIDLSLAELDRSLRIIWTNGRFRDTFQLPTGVGAGSELIEAVPDETLERIVRHGVESEEMVRAVEIVLSRGGTRRHFLISVCRLPAGDSALVSFYEITEWAQRQRQVMEASRIGR